MEGAYWDPICPLHASTGGLEPNVVSYSSAITAYDRAEKWWAAHHVLVTFPMANVRANVVSFNAGLSAFEVGAEWQKALLLLHQMPSVRLGMDARSQSGRLLDFSGGVMDVISIGSAINACDSGECWEMATQLLAGMGQAHLISYNSTISSCGKGGQWEQALELLSRLQAARLADVVGFNATISYNSAISALERGSQHHLALEILTQMPSASVLPDVISYNATIDACAGLSFPGDMYRLTAPSGHLFNGLSIEDSIVQ
ncbi:unnamed protein product [Symbiodinium sp. CCMP2592]|nr:unnamed protein product [Symbiodinium sp. CCMP2592]